MPRPFTWSPLLVIPLCGLAACDPEPADTDGDGLPDDTEAGLGTDPAVADTDGDGYEDGAEVSGNTNPLDDGDHPYLGGWPIGACRNGIDGEGWAVGDVVEDFDLQDQFNESVAFHDLCGNLIVLESGAMWCAPCQEAAPEMQSLAVEYRDRGVLFVSLLTEDEANEDATADDAATWANTHGLTYPVLADPGAGVAGRFVTDDEYLIPNYTFISSEMVVLETDLNPSGTAEVRDRIEQYLGG